MKLEQSFVTYSGSSNAKNVTTRKLRRISIALASWSCFALSGFLSSPATAQDVLPKPQPPFKGKAGRVRRRGKEV